MIYTLTFNPAIDYAMYVDSFKEGVTNRSSKEVLYFDILYSIVKIVFENYTYGMLNDYLTYLNGGVPQDLGKYILGENGEGKLTSQLIQVI